MRIFDTLAWKKIMRTPTKDDVISYYHEAQYQAFAIPGSLQHFINAYYLTDAPISEEVQAAREIFFQGITKEFLREIANSSLSDNKLGIFHFIIALVQHEAFIQQELVLSPAAALGAIIDGSAPFSEKDFYINKMLRFVLKDLSFFYRFENCTEQLKEIFPGLKEEILTNKIISEFSIADGTEWKRFVGVVNSSVRDNKTKLNADDSVSFFFHKCGQAGCSDCLETKKIMELFEADYIVSGMEYYQAQLGLPLIGENLLERIEYPEAMIVEYKFNLSPENFDALLKLNSQYSGYRENKGILELRHPIAIKPGAILLFPVYSPEEGISIVRCAGCQTLEIFSIQLFQLLREAAPEREFKLNPSAPHMILHAMETYLGLTRSDLENILGKVLENASMLSKSERKSFTIQATEGDFIVSNPVPSESLVKMLDINDENTSLLYLKYGNIGAHELSSCKSVEADTLQFLETVLAYLNNKKDHEPDTEVKSKIIESIGLINLIKEKEIARKEASLTASGSTPAWTTRVDHGSAHPRRDGAAADRTVLDTFTPSLH